MATIERTFALRFLTSLQKLRTNSNPTTRRRRSLRIKAAAYSSMARAVGSRRVWSRVLLSRIRTRRLQTKPRKEVGSRADELRKLVPGGSRMETGKLLEEAAHYVECLALQVRVMQNIAHRYSL
ncbi:Transcription factor IBH1 [Linum perenne]